MRALSQLIQLHRKKKNLSQAALAKLSHVTQSMVSKVESNKDVKLSTINAIAAALDLQVVVMNTAQALSLVRQLNLAQSKKSVFEQVQVKDDDE